MLLRIVLLILVVVGLLVLRGVCFVGLVGWLWVVDLWLIYSCWL